MKVLHLIATLEVGGVERQLTEFVSRTPADIRHEVLCLTRGGPLRALLERKGVPVTVLDKRGRYDAAVLPRLLEGIRGARPDLVHSYMFTSNFWGGLATLLNGGPPWLASVRCLDPREMRGFYLWADRFLLPRAGGVVAVSHAIASHLTGRVGLSSRRVEVIWNGKDPTAYLPEEGREDCRRELGISPKERLIGLVGRLHPQKGQDILLEAVPRVLEGFPGARFVLVGQGPDVREVKARIRSSGLEEQVSHLPFREDMASLYAALDVVVLPSRFEGLPNVVVEAMAACRPVVASDIPGTDELIRHEVEGLLVPPEDAEALAREILRVLEDPDLAARLAETGHRRFLRELTYEATVARTVDLYRRVLGEGDN